MNIPQQEREKKITGMAPVVRVFAAIFVVVALSPLLARLVQFSANRILYLLSQVALSLIVLYAIFGLDMVRKKIAGANLTVPLFFDRLTLLGSFVFITAVIFITGGLDSNFRILLLPPILFYTVRFGLKWGLVSSTLAAAVIAGAYTVSFLDGSANTRLELDLVYAGIFFLIAWLVGSIVDLERNVSRRLSSEMIVDRLTGLFNHRHLQDELKKRIEVSSPVHFAIILADLDFFRHYNETYGDQNGDKLLVRVARRIADVLGERGLLFRFGSDEFAIILDAASRRRALQIAEEIRCCIMDVEEGPYIDNYWKFKLTASLGFALFPDDAANGEELLKKTGEALFRAKVISGNKVEACFSIFEQLRLQADNTEIETLERLKTFLTIINTRDHYTFGHSERVLIYASIIGSLTGFRSQEKRILQYGAYLHDIGKIEIGQAILNKHACLTGEEWEIVKNHPIWSAEMVKQIRMLAPAAEAILYHHERYDGKGRPFGLASEKIPLNARIVALADSFDAMTVERPYKKIKSCYEAVVDLKQNSSVQFDPQLVEIFVDFLKNYRGIEEILAVGVKERFLAH